MKRTPEGRLVRLRAIDLLTPAQAAGCRSFWSARNTGRRPSPRAARAWAAYRRADTLLQRNRAQHTRAIHSKETFHVLAS